MTTESAIALLARQDWQQTVEAVQPAVTNTFKAGGAARQQLKTLLHGAHHRTVAGAD